MDINTVTGQLCSAITNFLNHKDFSPQGSRLFKQKEKQLINFSRNANCVPVCIKILQELQDQQIKYFASVLLKDKLKYDFYQLDKNSINQTYQMLVKLIKNVKTSNKILLTNIMLCLTYLYIHKIQEIGTVINFFQTIFGNQLNDKKNMHCFLKFLELVPEEIKNNRLVIDEQTRNRAQQLIQQQQTQIIGEMHGLVNNFNNKSSSAEYQILLRAFTSWLQLNTTNENIIFSLHEHNLLNLAFSCLHDQLIFQAAANCIRLAIQIMVESKENHQLLNYISHKLFEVMPLIDQALKQCNFEIVEEYAKLLCDYGSNSSMLLVTHYNENIQNMIYRMLVYTQKQQIEAFSPLVDFWQCFIDAMIKYSENSPLTKETSGSILSRLFMILFNRIKYTWDDLVNLDDISERNLVDLHQRAEDIQQYRQQGGYLFYSISKNIGQQTFVKEVLNAISQLDKENKQDFWVRAESMIHSVRDVAQNYPGPTPQICQFVLLYEQLNPNLVMVKRSFCRVFHQLFTMKNKNEQFILKMLGYVIDMLQIPLLADRAEKAFNKCCRENSQIISKHLQQIYGLLNKYPNRTGLLSGIAEVIKKSPEIVMQVMPTLLLAQIQKLKQAENIDSKSAKKKQIFSAFDSIFSLLNSVPEKSSQTYFELLEQFLIQIWPQLQTIIQKPMKRQSDEDKIVEQAIKLLKIILRSIPDRYLKYMKEISNVIVESFKKYPISSFVYYYQVVLSQFRSHSNPELSTYLLEFFKSICTITFNQIQNYEGVANLSILADDFLGLAKRIIIYNKLNLLLESNQIENIFKFAMMGLESSHPQVASSSSQFFQIVFMIYWTPYSRTKYKTDDIGEIVEYDNNFSHLYQQLKQYVLPSVPALILDLFKCLQKVPSQSARDNILDCLTAVALAFPLQSQNLWSNPLNYLQVDILTAIEKQKLKSNLQKLSTNDIAEFTASQKIVTKLLFLISKRYYHRVNRQNLKNYK